MAIIAKDTQKEWVLAPEGLQRAVCVDVVDHGIQETEYGDRHKVDLRWQSNERDIETGKRYLIVNWYTLSLHEKATLRQHLESWRGCKFKPEQVRDGFDLERLIEVNCQLTIVHSVSKNGRTYANVRAIMPLTEDMERMTPEDYIRVRDREDADKNPTSEPEPGADDNLPF